MLDVSISENKELHVSSDMSSFLKLTYGDETDAITNSAFEIKVATYALIGAVCRELCNYSQGLEKKRTEKEMLRLIVNIVKDLSVEDYKEFEGSVRKEPAAVVAPEERKCCTGNDLVDKNRSTQKAVFEKDRDDSNLDVESKLDQFFNSLEASGVKGQEYIRDEKDELMKRCNESEAMQIMERGKNPVMLGGAGNNELRVKHILQKQLNLTESLAQCTLLGLPRVFEFDKAEDAWRFRNALLRAGAYVSIRI